MDKYLTVSGESVTEKVIEKSKFITFSSHTETEEEAKAFILKVRSLHPFATHVCYGYVADNSGNLMRFSDDGEPQGTAGTPILDVIRAKKLLETSVAVVRYFGGIKLGAGGLVRAYSSSAAENLNAAEICVRQMCEEYVLRVAYPEVTPLIKFLSSSSAVKLSEEYLDFAFFTVAIKKEESEKFLSSLKDCMLGRVYIKKNGEYFFSFKE